MKYKQDFKMRTLLTMCAKEAERGKRKLKTSGFSQQHSSKAKTEVRLQLGVFGYNYISSHRERPSCQYPD